MLRFQVIWFLLFLIPSCGGGGGTTTPDPTEEEESTETESLEFSADLTDLADIDFIVPSGNVAGNTIKVHSFLRIKSGVGAVNVYAPMDCTLSQISYYTQSAGETEPIYMLFFQSTEDENFYFYLDHISSLSAALDAVAPQTPAVNDSRTSPPSSSVTLSAGELIGTTDGTDVARSWDFGVYDLDNTNPVGDPDRYAATDRYLTGLCPYDYFAANLKQAYLDLAADAAGNFPSAGACRNPCRDVAGTAAGLWYLDSGTDSTYESSLGLATTITGKVRWGGAGGEHEDSTGSPTDPEEITVGESTLYESSSGYLWVELESATRLKVSYGTGTPPGAFPTSPSDYKTYTR